MCVVAGRTNEWALGFSAAVQDVGVAVDGDVQKVVVESEPAVQFVVDVGTLGPSLRNALRPWVSVAVEVLLLSVVSSYC